MDIHVNDLKAVVKRLKKVVPKRSTKPILESVKIQVVNENTAFVTGTNLEIAMTIKLSIMGGDYENFLIPFKTLETLSKRKNTDWYKVICNDDKVSFLTESFKKTVTVESAEEFPELPAFSNKWKELPVTFTELLKNASLFASYEATRYALNSILIDKDNIVGCSGKQLAKFVCKTDIEKQTLVPTKLASVIESGETFMFNSNKQYFFLRTHDETVTIIALLVDGHYPNYNDVIPEFSNEILFNNDDALVAMADIKDTANNGNDAVSFIRPMEITVNGEIKFYSKNPIQNEETENILPCQYSGKEINIRVDWNLLNPIMKNFPEFNLHLKDDNAPIVFVHAGDRIVLMPLKK